VVAVVVVVAAEEEEMLEVALSSSSSWWRRMSWPSWYYPVVVFWNDRSSYASYDDSRQDRGDCCHGCCWEGAPSIVISIETWIETWIVRRRRMAVVVKWEVVVVVVHRQSIV
jgi:hypothetical protein